jgi:hypothetical protein
MSNVTTVAAYVAAQINLANSAMDLQVAFAESAIACNNALNTTGVTLQKLADANREGTREYAGMGVTSGFLYVSVEAVSYHALTGQLLSLAFDEEITDEEIVPTDVQSLIVSVKHHKFAGVKPIKAILRKAKTQQEAIELLFVALEKANADEKAAKATPAVETASTGAGSDDESDGESMGSDVSPITPDHTVESHLAAALALLSAGSDMTDSVRDMVARLISFTGPVAVPAAA